jgi:predicted alpha-1,2-mannosidase
MRKLFLLLCAFSCSLCLSAKNDVPPVDYVNPLTGTLSTPELSTGNLYPAIAVPWGMNFWTPQTGKMGDGWVYSYTSNKIKGFKQTHQPSPWINDYGQFVIMPVTGQPRFDEETRGSWFSHLAETVKPHYYKVYLADFNTTVELAPTSRAAVFRFTFPKGSSAYVDIDALDKGSWVKVIPSERKIIGYTTKNSSGVPDNFKNYFVITFDQPFNYTATVNGKKINTSSLEAACDHAGGIVGFGDFDHPINYTATVNGKKVDTSSLETTCDHAGGIVGFGDKGGIVNAHVASSFISIEQAELNLKEVDGKSLEKVSEEGAEQWNKMLGRIEVKDENVDHLRTFYTCLYRTLLFPRCFFEYNAKGDVIHYSPFNGNIEPGYMYTDVGVWDTFRALFPLLNLMYPSVNEQMQAGFANIYKESGFLPEWISPGHRDCMVGNNSASVVADAYLKGLRGYDIETLWKAVLHGANSVHPTCKSTGRLGYDLYNKLGYVPYDKGINESGARTLEYAYDDWCIYKLGKALSRPDKELAPYKKHAMNYKNLFDKSILLMRGRMSDGTFIAPFNPLKWGDTFTEGNSWHYTWSVFHDPQGLINLMGGKDTFNKMMDSIFVQSPVFDDSYYHFVIHEIREMQIMNFGQYAHGNQPIQHALYLYDYSGQPWKTQYWTHQVMNRLYRATPDGYCGDEDNGQTSAWYVFSALGFYPVCPGSNQYILGAPYFKDITLHLENGNRVNIHATGASDDHCYISTMTLNGQPYSKNYLEHADLLKGGTINFEMSDKPNMTRGTAASDAPYSFSNELNKKTK